MSQFEWDYLEQNKQNIIEGKIITIAWEMERLIRPKCFLPNFQFSLAIWWPPN